jgi:hypothetical protein
MITHKNNNLIYDMNESKKRSINISKTNDTNNILANILMDKFDTMNYEEKKYYVTKCLSPESIDSLLLRYELINRKNIPKEMTFREFLNETTKILQRYQSRAGGDYFEDIDWCIHLPNNLSNRYEIYDNEIYFENTIHVDRYNELFGDNNNYMKNIMNVIKNLATNFDAEFYTYLKNRDRIYYCVIKCWMKN